MIRPSDINRGREDAMKRVLVMGWLVAAGLVWTALPAAAASWETDYAQAATNANKAGKYMLLDFSGSDWCGWCMKLDKEVFKQAEFKNFAQTNLVCVLVDFPRQKAQSKKLREQNAALAKKYGIRGYPTVLLLSPSGELVGRTGYREGGPKPYVEHLQAMIAQDKQQRAPGK